MNTKKIRFSYLDLVIVVLVLAVLAAGGLYLTKNIAAEKTVIEFEMEAKDIEKEVAEGIREGDKVFESNKNEYIGEITKVTIEPMTEVAENKLLGRFEMVVVPEKYTAFITIKGNGMFTEDITKIEEYELYYGKTMYVKNKDFAVAGVVIGVRELSAKEAQ